MESWTIQTDISYATTYLQAYHNGYTGTLQTDLLGT